MIPKAFDDIEEQDLQILVDNGVLEGKTIEYKQELTVSSDKEKKEFLADVSSFANASGGDLIYGIVEDRSTGAPERLEGLTIINEDKETRKLEEMIRYGIQPRIPSVNIRAIPLKDNKTALIIRVLKSWVSPHRVVYGGYDKFYSRNSKGKYPLDVGELRIAFNLSSGITEQIRKFRESRISEIYANETPVPLLKNAKIVLHLIPLSSVSSGQIYDISRLPLDPRTIVPFSSSYGWNGRYNLDGYLTYSKAENMVEVHSYVQLFRNGILEAVECSLLDNSDLKIPHVAFEEKIMNAFKSYISILEKLNVGMPIFAFLTLVDVKGYSMATGPSWIFRGNTINKDVLSLPEIITENSEFEVEKVLKPWFDTIWNACGFPCSLNYDSSGKWIGRA